MGDGLKLKIEITPEGPELSEIELRLDKLEPPLSGGIKQRLMDHASVIREKLLYNVINETGLSYHQTQTVSENNHNITITGRMFKETLIDKIKKFF